MIKLLTLNERNEWNSYVKRSFIHDFYHTWHYHALDKSGNPILLIYEEGEDFIAFPFLKRSIPDSSFFDLSSVYGYPGPIASKKFEQLGEGLIDNFKKSFLKFLKNEQIVSVFSRLHPFFDQHILMKEFEGLHENGLTVALDLNLPLDVQRKKYDRSTSRSIKRCRDKGYHVRESKRQEDIDIFVDIYTENMRRIGSTEFYLFNRQYFRNLIHSDEFDCRLLLVCLGEEITCATIISFSHGIIQAHLVATKASYLNESPAKFLVDEITIIGRERGMKFFHLGGGLCFKEDSLFRWKSAFSDLFLNYKSFRFIANQKAYNYLLDKKGVNRKTETDYFPLYRAFIALFSSLSFI